MSELQYYSTREETLELIGCVAEAHALRLVPEIPILNEPRLTTFERVTPEVVALLAEYPVLQLEGAFTTHPLTFKRRDSGTAAGSYYLADNVGPRLRWFLPGLRDRELTPGSLNALESYRDPETNQVEPASTALKAAFRAAVDTLKSRLVKHTLGKEKIWIGEQALEQVKSGRLVIDR